MTIAGHTFMVNQAGTTGSCSYSISPTMATFPRAGGTGTVAMTVANGCGWSAVSQASWIMVTNPGSGNGNGTVSYSVAVNASGLKRKGTIIIGNTTFTVFQTAS